MDTEICRYRIQKLYCLCVKIQKFADTESLLCVWTQKFPDAEYKILSNCLLHLPVADLKPADKITESLLSVCMVICIYRIQKLYCLCVDTEFCRYRIQNLYYVCVPSEDHSLHPDLLNTTAFIQTF